MDQTAARADTYTRNLVISRQYVDDRRPTRNAVVLRPVVASPVARTYLSRPSRPSFSFLPRAGTAPRSRGYAGHGRPARVLPLVCTGLPLVRGPLLQGVSLLRAAPCVRFFFGPVLFGLSGMHVTLKRPIFFQVPYAYFKF